MFDNIDRSLLWLKLVTVNVSSKLITALKAMYSSIQSCIKINQHQYTEYITSTIGVKQGDPASSILCLFFLNDIIKTINTDNVDVLTLGQTKLFMLLSADDAAVFAYSPESLQNILNQIQVAYGVSNLIPTKQIL